MKIQLLSFFAASTAVLAFAATDYQMQVQLNSQTLVVDIQEKATSNNACDLVVDRFQYLPDLRILDIQLTEIENCPLDVVGQRKAHLEWNVPFNFSSTKELSLRVNGKVRTKVNLDQIFERHVK